MFDICSVLKFLVQIVFKQTKASSSKQARLCVMPDMSPGTKAKVKEQQLVKKRATSRAWHAKYKAKGVSQTSKKTPLFHAQC